MEATPPTASQLPPPTAPTAAQQPPSQTAQHQPTGAAGPGATPVDGTQPFKKIRLQEHKEQMPPLRIDTRVIKKSFFNNNFDPAYLNRCNTIVS